MTQQHQGPEPPSHKNYTQGCRCNNCRTQHRIYISEWRQRTGRVNNPYGPRQPSEKKPIGPAATDPDFWTKVEETARIRAWANQRW